MKETNNCIVITNKGHCSRWLYSLNDNISNLIFVDPDDKIRLSSLVDSVDVDVVLVHLQSQDNKNESASDYKHSSLNSDLSIVEDLLRIRSSLVIIALVEAVNQDLVLSIIRSGVRDIIKIGSPAHEAQAIISRHQKRNQSSEHSEQSKGNQGYISTLINARIADGNALFAIHMALELQTHGPTLLLDIGQPNGDVMLMMGLSSKFSLTDLILNRTRLDATLIDTGFAKHSSGLSMLSMPENDKVYTELTPSDLLLILHALRKHFKFIFINLSGTTNPDLLRVVLSITSSTFLLLEQTIPSCKHNHDLITSLRQLKINAPGLHLAVDRYLANQSPSAENIAKSFEIPLACLLPSQGELRLACMNTGEAIEATSTYAKEIRRAVRKIPAIQPDTGKHLISHLFGKFSSSILKLKSAW